MAAGGGALLAEARLNTATKAGHDALEMIKFFEQEAAFSIGFRTVKARRRGDVRELHDVELYEVSPVPIRRTPRRSPDRRRGQPTLRRRVQGHHGRGRTAAADRDGGGDPVLGVWAAGGGDRARRAPPRGAAHLPPVRRRGR